MDDPIFEELGQLHTAEEAARYLDTTERSLENWRYTSQGPKYVKIGGQIRYPYIPARVAAVACGLPRVQGQ